MQHYVVVRRRTQAGQFLLTPRHTMVLVSRNDLSLEEHWYAATGASRVRRTPARARCWTWTCTTRRHGIRPIIRFVMQTTAHLTRSARRWCVRFAKTNFRLDWLYQAMVTLEAMTPSRSRAPPCKAAA